MSQDKLLALVINYGLVKETKTHGTFFVLFCQIVP